MKPKHPCKYSTANYLRLLKKGVGDVPRNENKEIGIVGGGMAGLVAGWLLKEAGHTIRIYEANKVVGGRIKTLRERFTSGLYAEAGAMRIPKNHKLTMWLVDDFNLKTYDGTTDIDNCLVYINGKHCTYGEYKNGHNLGLVLKKNEIGKTGDQLFKSAIAEHIGTARTDWKKWDRYSLRQFLRQKAKLSLGAVELIGTELGHETNLSISLVEAIRDAEDVGPDATFCHIKGGMDRLPRAFTEKTRNRHRLSRNLANELRYNARVIEIRPRMGKFCLKYENPVTRAQAEKDFDYIVVTTPFSALRLISLPGLLTPRKMRAIRQLHYDNSTKIILEFADPFWRHRPFRIFGGQSFTDLPLRWISYPQKEQFPANYKRALILASYTWGSDSLRWTSLPEDDRLRFALRDLAIVHQKKEEDIRDWFIGGMSHSWADDEFTCGAFALFEPHQQTDFFDDVWRPDQGVHFAGEHTTIKHGWIEGAVESGIRVAHEIMNNAHGY